MKNKNTMKNHLFLQMKISSILFGFFFFISNFIQKIHLREDLISILLLLFFLNWQLNHLCLFSSRSVWLQFWTACGQDNNNWKNGKLKIKRTTVANCVELKGECHKSAISIVQILHTHRHSFLLCFSIPFQSIDGSGGVTIRIICWHMLHSILNNLTEGFSKRFSISQYLSVCLIVWLSNMMLAVLTNLMNHPYHKICICFYSSQMEL